LIKSLLLRLFATPAFSGMVTVLEKLDREPADLLRVLTYHRVDHPTPQPYLSPELRSASPETFVEQISFVSKHYQPVHVEQVLDYFENGTPLPSRAILVTFDDAYIDFEQHAWPVLRSHNVPVILFVPTAFPNHPERTLWWDKLFHAINTTPHLTVAFESEELSLATETERQLAYKKLRDHVKSLSHEQALAWTNSVCAQLNVLPPAQNHIMNWDTLRRLASEGVTLGAHTQTHPLLNRVSVEQAIQEARDSWRDLEREVGSILPIFAYPSGGFSRNVVQALEVEGFKLAFTTKRGINQLKSSHPLMISRINVGGNTPLAALRTQLLSSTMYVIR
jgi:peptidoglycan/xylan/chitin deacetylase (PgdA/CDA1 family)